MHKVFHYDCYSQVLNKNACAVSVLAKFGPGETYMSPALRQSRQKWDCACARMRGMRLAERGTITPDFPGRFLSRMTVCHLEDVYKYLYARLLCVYRFTYMTSRSTMFGYHASATYNSVATMVGESSMWSICTPILQPTLTVHVYNLTTCISPKHRDTQTAFWFIRVHWPFASKLLTADIFRYTQW